MALTETLLTLNQFDVSLIKTAQILRQEIMHQTPEP